MRLIVILAVLLIGIVSGVFLQKPLSGLPPHVIGSAKEDNAAKPSPENRTTKDKKLVSVDPEIAKALGIEIATAEAGVIPTEIRVVGTVGFNEDKLARIVPRVPGTVRQVLKSVGERVAAGESLAVIDSKEIADARSTYLAAKDKLSLAEMTFNREDELFRKKVSSEKDLINARRDLTQARSEMRIAAQSLLTVGFRDADLTRLDAGAGDLSRFDILAPFAGEVVEKRIFVGEFLPQDRNVFTLADLDVVWVYLQIPPEKLKDVSIAKPVRITAGTGLSAEATLAYIAPVVSDETRAARARIDLPNPEHRWRPGTVIEAVLEGSPEPASVTVPSEAVQTVDGQTSVFLPVEDGFRLQAVKIGRANDKTTEILKGLKAGDKVATGETFALKSELEKGAGEDND
jgi:cobalt-zinc-cadmium efflux system membrane fusion protein